ncbi:MAG TPA: hypothetical protein DCS93_22345 [Microscillaceae bacterium]|nr:hypothetical protein [Microscillaceae bacterium]
MIKNITSSLLTIAFCYWVYVSTAQAQHIPFQCGAKPTTQQLEYIDKHIIPYEKNQARLRTHNVVYVPIKFHIVKKSDGTGGPISLYNLKAGVESLNRYYSPVNIHFYIYEAPDIILSDEFYTYDNTTYPTIAPGVSDAINVYVVGGFKSGGIAGFAWFGGSIYMGNSYLVGSVFAHEMGHHYNLSHTHGSSNTPGTTKELVNGSNCTTTGDRICDTPADPNRWLRGCKIDGTPRDANGDLYQPDGRNVMSYAKGCSNERFSQGQYDRVMTSHNGEKGRQNLRSIPGPTIDSFAPEIGSAGATITINGSGFSNNVADNTVIIGDKQASIISASSTQLIVTIPTGVELGADNIGVVVDKQYAPSPKKLTIVYGEYPYVESFENGLGYWVGYLSSILRWTRNSGGTPTNNTGPSNAADGNYYMYAEADSLQQLGYGSFESFYFDLSKLPNPEISFSYHAYGATVDSMMLEVVVLGNTSGERYSVWKVKGDQGNTWHQAKVDLSAFVGKIVYFIFWSINSKTLTADMAIDHVQINNASTFYISSFSPTQATIGTTVTITGAGFSTTPANNLVKFNGTTATVSAATANSLTVTVPEGATTGKISVQVGNEITTSVGDFTVLSSDPTITGFSPASGPVGTEVTIQGYNFEAIAANNLVKFNGTTAAVTNATANELKVTVPTGATTGRITVEIGGKIATSNDAFVVTANTTDPVIVDFNPKFGPVGTEVTIQGANFEAIAANNTVDFNGMAATVKSATATQLVVEVPSQATSGKISITAKGITAVSTQNFIVTSNTTDPVIIDFYPKSGPVNTLVSITGGNFAPTLTNNIVKFNGVAATIQTATNTELKVLVPINATTGKISVEVAGITAASLDDFTVTGEGVTVFNIQPAKVITPNGDQINDVWNITGIQQVDSYHIRVFSKAGQVVYDSTDYTTPWDGTRNGSALAPGIYYYNILMSARGVKERKTGYVALIK